MWHKNNNDTPFSETCTTDVQHNCHNKIQLSWSEWWKEIWGGWRLSSPALLCSCTLWVMVLMTHSSTLLCVVGLVGGCFVLPADSSPPRVGPGRCRGVTTLINCLLSPVCLASCLPCRHTCYGDLGLWGGSGKLEGGSWQGEGRGGLLQPRQPWLSEQQCCRVEHGPRLAWAWQGSGLSYCCLLLAALLCAGDKVQAKNFEAAKTRADDVWGNLSLFLAVKRGI